MPNWIKAIFKGAAIGLAAALLSFGPFILLGWVDHTSRVQEWIAKDVAAFKQADIDWTQFDPNADPEVLMDQIREVLISEIKILHVDPTRDAMREYEETLYELIRILTNEPEDRGAIIHGIFDAVGAQTRFYMAVERFQNSTLYAMRFTI
jgi:hypothetical protein